MKETLKSLFERLEQSGMTPAEWLELESFAREQGRRTAAERSLAASDRRVERARTCPHCGTGDAIKFGRDDRGQQRYRCLVREGSGCGRTFTALTGTAFSGMKRRDQWGPFMTAMSKGYRTIDELHRSNEVRVSRLTLWRWRHRFLCALENQETPALTGVVEADETYFRDSFKGSRGWKRNRPPVPRPPRRRGRSRLRGLSREQIPVMTAIDRRRQTHHAVLDGRHQLENALEGRIEPFSVLCSDGLAAYRKVAFREDLCHVVVNARDEPKPFMLQGATEPYRLSLARINNLHERMKTWANHRARGVSTAYLSHYLTWLESSSRERLADGSVFEIEKTT